MTATSPRLPASPTRRLRRLVLATALAAGITTANFAAAQQPAQQPQWQPTRVPTATATQVQQLRGGGNATSSQFQSSQFQSSQFQGSASDNAAAENLGSGVTLRWKKTSNSNSGSIAGTPTNSSVQTPFAASDAFDNHTGINAANAFDHTPAAATHSAQRVFQSDNPLRTASGTRQDAMVARAAYQQQPGTNDPFRNPFGDDTPALGTSPGSANPGLMPEQLPGLPPNSLQPQAPSQGGGFSDLPEMPDPLSAPELAPQPGNARPDSAQPGSILDAPRQSPFPSPSDSRDTDRNQNAPELVPTPRAADDEDELGLPNRRRNDANSITCNELRDRVRQRPLTQVSLDVSPSFGEGLRSVKKDTEQQRLEFAATSRVRDWSDNNQMVVATGRLIDLRNDRVVLDVNGSERTILLQDLSDVDIAYVGEAWNIPLKCGIGNEPYEGRNFVHSAVQWKAPGHCHKPLYFEQTQLERYGHEIGPVLQPIVSTAHFFGNIAVLPYKMGIHPPNECQYSLGYYRPGNCAPYMLQPIPWSLRGAAVQAGVITGAAALIP